MAEKELIALRDLPGVSRVTDLVNTPRAFEYPQTNYTLIEIDDIVASLFGLPDWCLNWDEMEFDDDEPYREEEAWNLNFKVATLPWEEARVFWESHGWDLSDGKGNELVSAHRFMRPLIACLKELHEDAVFHPQANARRIEREMSDEDMAERLKREADEFLSRRRRC